MLRFSQYLGKKIQFSYIYLPVTCVNRSSASTFLLYISLSHGALAFVYHEIGYSDSFGIRRDRTVMAAGLNGYEAWILKQE